MRPPLTAVLEASCLVDARRDAGIGSHARHLVEALRAVPDLRLELAMPRHPPLSESRPGRFVHAQPGVMLRATRLRPAVVHGLGGEPVLGWPRNRQVVTVHDAQLWTGAMPGGLRGLSLRRYASLQGQLLRRCAAIIAVSQTTASEAVAAIGLDPARIHIVPHGVAAAFSPDRGGDDAALRAAAGVGDDAYLLWVGSLRHHDPRKRLDLLLDAVSRLPEEHRRLALAGSGGEEASRLAEAAAARRIRLILCGRQHEAALAALYRGAAVVVIPSAHEGFGLPMLEAMACAAPVVASRAGNLPAMGRDAVLLVEPENPEALAEALHALLSDPGRARDLGRAGPKLASGFTWQRTAELTAAVYRRVAGLSPTDPPPAPDTALP